MEYLKADWLLFRKRIIEWQEEYYSIPWTEEEM